MTITGYEIDFLPVGEESKSGDAILFRYLEDDEFKIILIDGGHGESGGVKTSDTILNHMREYYYPNGPEKMRIDHIICSHPDSDHVGGLEEIMDKCDVGTFWINNPEHYIHYDNLENDHKTEKFCKSNADTVRGLIIAANRNHIPVEHPLQGELIGPLVVCSPSEDFYKKLVKGELERQGGAEANFKKVITNVINWIRAAWGIDYLYRYPTTSVCNESSTVLFGNSMANGDKILLTADAGIEALSESYEYLEVAHRYTSGSLNFMQMPHHGSRHNVNTKVLDALLGKKIPRSSHNRGHSVASVARQANDYPRKAVVHAFMTRGYSCYRTAGQSIRYPRGDWGPITPIPYPDIVESPDE